MASEHAVDVLVVGAGPVGLLTGLLLAENGVHVEIIDKEERTAARSYACVLHPRSLKILDRVGLASAAIEAGLRVNTIAFYEGPSRRAELQLSKLPVDFPFVVILPQSELEELLEERLRSKHRVEVGWNHRLADLHTAGATVVASVHKLGYACTGYLVSELERLVMKRLRIHAAFVAGADGHSSLVRQGLEIPFDPVVGAELFAVREITVEGSIEPEVRLVLDDTTTSVCLPLSENRCRWSCQLGEAELGDDHETKQRTAVLLEQEAFNLQGIQQLQAFLRKRMPWFETPIKEIDWSATVQFERRLARRFGQDRCWLAGDAAHQTGPAGVQSMNLGLSEAEDLADKLAAILRGRASLETLEDYNLERRGEWQRLLGAGLTPTDQASPWVKRRAARILTCLPASGADLVALAGQLGLTLG
jgi:2-polyprenyl-6-methoxyphenol hydroxylase-like FAD-dependent oxidoreductase